jgi:ribosomal protein S12 methylthiotransferase
MKIRRDFAARPKVGMISLGCAKNLVDAEIMLGSVLQRGMEITSCPEDADVLVVNTCAFIDSAKEESIAAILEAHQQRGLGRRPHQKLIVSGCMSQRFAKELRPEMPEVDAFIGLDQVSELGAIVEKVLGKRPTSNAERATLNGENDEADFAFADTRPTYIPDYDTPRFRLTPSHFAYVKICRRLQSPVQFLRNSPNARQASQPRSEICSGRNERIGARRRARNQLDQPGYHLLRDGFGADRGRAAPVD